MVAGRGEENESGGLWGLGRWEEGWVVLTYDLYIPDRFAKFVKRANISLDRDSETAINYNFCDQKDVDSIDFVLFY